MFSCDQLFDKYDADGSGGIDFDEFKVLLKDMGIYLSEPKALAYFKRCDKMRRGHISFEEFRLALYTCDPKNPNRTMGFAPGQALSPKDLFEMFDKEEQGAIDRATFIEILEFLGRKLPLDQVEGIFATHEDPEIEMMPYYQFRKVWLGLVDVRAELRNRHEKFSRFMTHAALTKKLEVLVNEEERQETRMLLEAATTLDEERVAAYRRWLVDESIAISKLVLSEAIDAAGQVYMFGRGLFGRLDGEPLTPDFVDFMDYDVVRDLWKSRVHPNPQTLEHDMNLLPRKSRAGGGEMGVHDEDDRGISSSERADSEFNEVAPPSNDGRGDKMSPPLALTKTKITSIAAARAFTGRQSSLVPTFLWGKRIRRVAVGPAVAFALADSGEVFCWGGNVRKWRYFYDSATPDVANNKFRGIGEEAMDLRLMTTRTEMLKQTLPSQAEQNQRDHDDLYLRQKYQRTFVKPVRPLATEEQKRRKLFLLGQYFDLLTADVPEVNLSSTDVSKNATKSKRNSTMAKKTPTSPGTTNITTLSTEETSLPTNPPNSHPRQSYQVLLETVEPDLNVDDLVVALELRGVHLAKQTRMELIDKLGDCLELEIECLGQKFHAFMKEQDKAARRAKHDRREKSLQAILMKTTMLWNELRILHEDIVRIERDEFTKTENEYIDMKRQIARAKQKIKRQAREGFKTHDALLHFNGLTSRGAPQRFFSGDQALIDISVGSRHALAIHQTGKLYTWGVGSFGRLGGVRKEKNGGKKSTPELTNDGDDDIDAWHRDVHTPQVISSLESLRFREVCCGYSHSLALTSQGEVYVWGSGTHGKLGVGSVPPAVESFTLTPILLHFTGSSSVRVRRISCGPSHSALLTTDGALFVWGSGDGGKLGLGDGRDVGEDRIPRNGGHLGVIESPTRVTTLSSESCVEVSCGTAHTVVITVASTSGQDGRVVGGRVYVAGSSHALGRFTPTFSHLRIPRIDDADNTSDDNSSTVITRVSCGNAHTGLVTSDGELLTWGNNVGGCTGHPIVEPQIKIPTRISCLYQYPRNLCLEKGVRAYQSSQNASCTAELALERLATTADLSSKAFSQTQQEMCPFWQVQLSTMCRIEQIVVVFKRTSTSLTGVSRSTERSDFSAQSTKRPSSSSSTRRTQRSSRSTVSGDMKYVALISEVPFDREERGKYSLAKAKGHSVFSSFTLEREGDVQWAWNPPVDTWGQFVRVQMENVFGMLSLVNVSVNGSRADEYNGPKVSDVVCAEGMTVAICRALSSKDTVRERFQRAIRADRNALWILEQMETFHPFVREELDAKPRDEDEDAKSKCVLCRPKEKCVICLLDDAAFCVEIQKDLERKRKEREDRLREQLEQERQRQEELLRQQKALMRGGQSLIQNKTRDSERRKAARDARAKAEATAKAKEVRGVSSDQNALEVLKRTLTLEEKCQKLLAMNMRTEEEEEEAEKRLAAELLAIDPIAAMANQAQNDKARSISPNQQSGIIAIELAKSSRRSLLARFGSFFLMKRKLAKTNATKLTQ